MSCPSEITQSSLKFSQNFQLSAFTQSPTVVVYKAGFATCSTKQLIAFDLHWQRKCHFRSFSQIKGLKKITSPYAVRS